MVSQAVTAVLMFASLRARWPMAGSGRPEAGSRYGTSSARIVVNGIGRAEEDYGTIWVLPNFGRSVDSGWTVWPDSMRPSSSRLPTKIGR